MNAEKKKNIVSVRNNKNTFLHIQAGERRTDKSIPVEPLSFCVTAGAVTDVHR